ncbi:MAG TPA: ATP-binding protein [Nevskiaceae bacterium]|nr:ATP-binding protein [Nevskiaceae bacterium]
MSSPPATVQAPWLIRWAPALLLVGCAVVPGAVALLTLREGLLAGLALGLPASALGVGLVLLRLGNRRAREERLRRALIDLGAGRGETRLPASDGELARLLNQLADLRYRQQQQQDDQQAQTALRLRQEIERLGQTNRELRQALEAAAQQARQQTEQFSNLSHELRTPLTAILGFADLLRRTELGPEQADYLATLDKAARGLLGLLNDLLDWSRIEAGRLSLAQADFSLSDALEDTLAMLAPLAYDKGLHLVHLVDHDVPDALHGDAQRLRQILTNLLSNAIKFTDHGEVELRVRRERGEGGKVWLALSVRDTGIGMSAEQCRRLFEPFRQFATSRAQAGSGLGLTIVRSLTQLMGGEVRVESEPGRGSRFEITLQLETRSEAAEARTRLRGKRLWLAEPHAPSRLALTHVLEFWGLQLTVFNAALPLRDRLRAASAGQQPDVVLLGAQPRDLEDAVIAEIGSLCMGGTPPLLMWLASVSPAVQALAIDRGAARALPQTSVARSLYRELCELCRALPAGERLAGMTVLVAEDNPAARRYMVALLTDQGAQVLEAASGLDALKSWSDGSVDVLLLDRNMPGMDGLSTLRALRTHEARDPRRRRCRVVVTSASLDPDTRIQLQQAGADELLLKPFDEAALLRVLAPRASARADGPPGAAQRIARDPEMVALLAEELPAQLAELEQAWARGDAVAARAAAHTLNGTAAFYHLDRLRSVAAEIEAQLSSSLFGTLAPDTLGQLRAALEDSLADLQGA